MKKDKKNGLKKLGETLLKKGLPLLGSIVTGGASDRIINLVKGATGILDDDPEAIEKQLSDHPGLLVKLKELEATNKVQLQELLLQSARLELEETQSYLGDVQDARRREIQVTNATGRRDWLFLALAIIVVVGFFTLVMMAVIGSFNGKTFATNGAINQLFGALVAGFTMVLSYFFGSSKGSADKTNLMEQRFRTQSPAVPAITEPFTNAKG
jgi:hypothetical protein